jgi:hypothetical protein
MNVNSPVLWVRIRIHFGRLFPDSDRIALGMRIRIQEGKNDPQKCKSEEISSLEVLVVLF